MGLTTLDNLMGYRNVQSTTSSTSSNDTTVKQSETAPTTVDSSTVKGQIWSILSVFVLFYIAIYGLTLVERWLEK
jgi:hypothetical protein